ncbi:MAG: ComF family protein [Dethiosulfatibacter sp.]|nr:ComF family protein [Dethiosulfatibacter sp.]
MIDSMLRDIAEILLPEKNTCLICGYRTPYINTSYICLHCESLLSRLEGVLCIKCSKPMDHDEDLCSDCVKMQKVFDKSLALFQYRDKTKTLINDFKYHNKSYLYKMFGYQMVKFLKDVDLTDISAVVPVPIHKSKELKRGYNQSELLASYISFNLGLPMLKLVKRNKDTTPQNRLEGYARWNNISGAFEISKGVSVPSKILLVDDIYTTGATVNECSKVLKQNGANKIVCLALAR